MREGHSASMKSVIGVKNKNKESFRELKKMVDEGYERFWSKPHRIKMRPISPSFGYIETKDFGSKEEKKDELNDLTRLVF